MKYWLSQVFAARIFTIGIGWLLGFGLSGLEWLAPYRTLVFHAFGVVWTAAGLYGMRHEYLRFNAERGLKPDRPPKKHLRRT